MISMQFNKQQKTILVMSGIIVGTILIFLFFIYLPKNAQMKKLKAELAEAKTTIDNIKRITGEEASLDVAIERYDKKIKELKLKLPQREESTIRDLAAEAGKMGIKILSINPAIAVDCRLPTNIKGYKCKELAISMEFKTSYKNFGDYIQLVREKIPAVIKFEQVNIKREGEASGIPQLLISFRIRMFILVPA